jgi:hypothetical protein
MNNGRFSHSNTHLTSVDDVSLQTNRANSLLPLSGKPTENYNDRELVVDPAKTRVVQTNAGLIYAFVTRWARA